MRESTIARNYAETLLALANKAGEPEGWGRMIQEIADSIARDVRLRNFLESPRVSGSQKIEILGKAFQDRFPRLLVRFLQLLVTNRRQMLIGAIAVEYQGLIDEAAGRTHAQVTVARPATDADREMLARGLSQALGREVVPHVTVNPNIIGGIVVKVGDRVMDGSVRRRLALLRSRLVYGAR